MKTARKKEPKTKRAKPAQPQSKKPDAWKLRLYVAGHTSKSLVAFANLKGICEGHLAGKYTIEIIDLMVNPKLAQRDQIIAIPTLIKILPPPIRKIIGDLSNTDRVLLGLDLHLANGKEKVHGKEEA